MGTMDLQQKIMNSFIGKVVRKDLALLVKGGRPVPTYVLEYLLGQYCASDDEEIINEGLEKVKQVIKNNYVHRAESEPVKGIIRENGRHRIIDKVPPEIGGFPLQRGNMWFFWIAMMRFNQVLSFQ